MKKLLAIILTLCTLLSLGTVSMAAEIHEDGESSATTTVTYGAEAHYVISIPERVVIDPEDGFGDLSISVSDVLLPVNHTLSLFLFSDFTLTDINDDTNTLGLRMWDAENGTEIFNGDTIFAVPTGSAGTEYWLEVALRDEVTKSGQYTGTITFVAEMTQDPVVFEFSIGNEYYYAEEGMTWAEWCDSEYNTSSRWYIYDNGQVVDGDLQYPTNPGTTIAARGDDVIIVDGQYGQLSY